MGTKNNPGKYDCYDKAEPNEPMFILLGRDKYAAGLVRLWVLLKKLEGVADDEKLKEALKCSEAMDIWAESLGQNLNENDKAFEELYCAITQNMAFHPEGFENECACHECLSYED